MYGSGVRTRTERTRAGVSSVAVLQSTTFLSYSYRPIATTTTPTLDWEELVSVSSWKRQSNVDRPVGLTASPWAQRPPSIPGAWRRLEKPRGLDPPYTPVEVGLLCSIAPAVLGHFHPDPTSPDPRTIAGAEPAFQASRGQSVPDPPDAATIARSAHSGAGSDLH